MSTYASPEELREVLDKVFTLLNEDAEAAAALKAADAPTRYEFTDLESVLNIRPAREDEEGNLLWQWSDEPGWLPHVRMTMSGEVANRFFQGKENVPVALATQRIKAGGDVKAALGLIPATAPVHERYRALVEAEYPHLLIG